MADRSESRSGSRNKHPPTAGAAAITCPNQRVLQQSLCCLSVGYPCLDSPVTNFGRGNGLWSYATLIAVGGVDCGWQTRRRARGSVGVRLWFDGKSLIPSQANAGQQCGTQAELREAIRDEKH